jgi:hypothetical protein
MKQEFQMVTRGLKALARKTEQMVKKVDRLQKAKAAPKRTVKAKTKTTKRAHLKKRAAKKAPAKRTYLKKRAAKKAPAKRTYLKKRATKKAPARRKAVIRKARTTTATATDRILNIVKRFKKGVAVPALVKKTRFNDKKIRDVLSRAFAQGRVRRVGRGVYVAV